MSTRDPCIFWYILRTSMFCPMWYTSCHPDCVLGERFTEKNFKEKLLSSKLNKVRKNKPTIQTDTLLDLKCDNSFDDNEMYT